jgi:DNA-directed RNA polymerase I, II, and III subunit RPABC2
MDEPDNIDEYYSSGGEDEDDSDHESDAESESENKKPTIKSGGALSDDEEIEPEVDDEEEEDESDIDDEEESELVEKKPKKDISMIIESDEDDESYDDDDEGYLQKFDKEINNNYILNIHPECKINNYDEISCLTKIVYNSDGIIVDPLHRTIPILTKYERTRVLGQRAKQINSGAKPFVKVPENIIDGYLVAEIELSQKRIPFIIRRPIPGGGSEYWNLKDLELIE